MPGGHVSVEAAEFVLKDSDGKTRARLALNPDGAVFLVLFDATGSPRSELSVSSDGTSLFAQAAADRKTRVISRVRSDGRSGIYMYDAAGKTIWSTPGAE